jgi:hypothetical protein
MTLEANFCNDHIKFVYRAKTGETMGWTNSQETRPPSTPRNRTSEGIFLILVSALYRCSLRLATPLSLAYSLLSPKAGIVFNPMVRHGIG